MYENHSGINQDFENFNLISSVIRSYNSKR